MRCLPFHLLLVFALGLALPAMAQADDDKPAPTRGKPAKASRDFVSQLTPAELELVQTRVKDWPSLETAKKQRIAHNIVRMRTMTDVEKKRLGEHIKRMRNKGRARGRSRDHATRALIGKALAREARKTLGRDFERALRKHDITAHTLEVSLSSVFWRNVSDRHAAKGDPVAPDQLPADFPAHWREHYARGHQGWSKAAPESKERAGMARRLHFKLAMHQGERFRGEVRGMDLKGDAQLDAISAAIRAKWPEAMASSLEDPDALLRAADRWELRRAVKRLLLRTERLEKEEAAVLVSLLNRLAIHHRKKDEAGAAASDAQLKRVLVKELRLAQTDVEGLPPASDPQARMAFLFQLLRKYGGHTMGGRPGGQRPGGQRPGGQRPGGQRSGREGRGPSEAGRGAGRRMPRMAQPEGVSDADWAIYVKVRDAAMAAKDFEALRALWTTKPEGMTDAGHQAVVEALKARMGDRKGRRER